MTKRTRLATLAVAAAAIPAVLTGCAASSGSSADKNELSVVGFSVLKTANEPVIADFQKTAAGKDVQFTTSYGASGDQARAVAGGLHADEVHLSLEPDVTKLVDAGIVDQSWNQTPTHGILTDSVVVFLVRKGNPLHIKTWDDLVKPGVDGISPNPATAGGAKWNIIAAYGAQLAAGKSPAQGLDYLSRLFKDISVLDKSGGDAGQTFASGKGDVLIASFS